MDPTPLAHHPSPKSELPGRGRRGQNTLKNKKKQSNRDLVRVRRDFVDRVTKELINQLLDNLLEDGIVNNGEKDSILEENSSRASKARCLIDTVRMKGDGASRRMIAHLQSRDPTLFSELGLSCGQTAPPAAEPQMEQEWSTILIPTTGAFWREKQNDKNIYPATKNDIKNRVALLITNIKFTDEKLNRNGAEKDEENTEKLLRALGYEVVKHTNLTGKEMEDALIEFSAHPKLKATDSVLVVIMSHGKLGVVLGVNWKNKISGDEKPDEFSINDIYKHLGSKQCPALLNKPKIIIIQACRGDKEGSVFVSDGADTALVCDDVAQPCPSASAAEEDIEDDNLQCVHKEKDFISLLSCTPDTVSYRQRKSGSLLIQYIVEVFNTVAHKDDIEELFRKVMQRFEDFSVGAKRQMPTKERCTLTKRFYFFPGL
ncbi:caspase a-like isoform X2 [Xiphias gladius]|uniref:caspase a-like isoform X2 n=1 Tax=Xiphias gladius TaxID=8245 RepID=UPI001A98FEED|nr:caspase a-like isoform X2 [Xiphias gladius]